MPDRAASPRILNATILFIDLMNSVALSNTLSLREYNQLINDYQDTLRGAVEAIQPSYPVGEYYLGGDQLVVFFYNPDDAGLHERAEHLRLRSPNSPKAAEIEQALERQKSRCLYGALRCAVQVKNSWIGHRRNIARVKAQQPVMDVGVGINTGNVVYQKRGDGLTRIEGFVINFAKRVEGFSRYGSYCKVMLSQPAYEVFRRTIIGHSMLKQRAFFEAYVPKADTLKGLALGTKVFELKFFHRLAGFAIPPEHIGLYTQIFKMDATNIWAYSNLINYYLYQQRDLTTARDLAHRALYSNSESEKVYYDLAVINLLQNELQTAEEYCQQCIRLNSEIEIAHSLLAEIELAGQRRWCLATNHRTSALALAPDSAANHLHLAMALLHCGKREDAGRHLQRANELYSDIMRLLEQERDREYSPSEIAALNDLARDLQLPEAAIKKPTPAELAAFQAAAKAKRPCPKG